MNRYYIFFVGGHLSGAFQYQFSLAWLKRHFVRHKKNRFHSSFFATRTLITSAYVAVQFAMSMKSKYANKKKNRRAYTASSWFIIIWTGVFHISSMACCIRNEFFVARGSSKQTLMPTENIAPWKFIILFKVHGTTKLIIFFSSFLSSHQLHFFSSFLWSTKLHMRDNNLLMVGWIPATTTTHSFRCSHKTRGVSCYTFAFSIFSLVSYIASILRGSNINYSERSKKNNH